MKVLLAIENEVKSDVFALAVESCFSDCQAIAVPDFGAAAAEIEKQDVGLIIAEATLNGETFQSLLLDPRYAGKDTPFLLFSDAPIAEQFRDLVTQIPGKTDIAVVMEKAAGFLHQTNVINKYCRIATKTLLLKNKEFHFDLYLQIADNKFLKVLHQHDTFDLEQYERFLKKEISFLYLLRSDFLKLMGGLLSMVNELNANPANLKVESSFSTVKDIFRTLNSAFESEGFTPEMQKLTEATVNLAINTLKSNPRLGDLLKKIENNKDDFIGWHSTALSFLCCKLASAVGWTSESTFYKLSLASLLHDISLPRDDLAQVQEKVDLERLDLTPEDCVLILNHPMESAKVVQSFPEVPGEVAFIVEQHHERPDGTGFPRGIDHKDISAISALFIIAHDLVNEMFVSQTPEFDFDGFLHSREKRYQKGAFGQVSRALIENARADK